VRLVRHGDREVSECDAEATDRKPGSELRTAEGRDGREDDGDDEQDGDVSRDGEPSVDTAGAGHEVENPWLVKVKAPGAADSRHGRKRLVRKTSALASST
jgi:hypothetical protein